jgi:hypothetical protein
MIVSLRTSPSEFEIDRGWLTHVPSRHNFRFDPEGNVTLLAHCDCAALTIREEQSRELATAFEEWRSTYWRVVEINREFAAHFRRPGIWGRWWRALVARIRLIILDPALEQSHAAVTVPIRVRSLPPR